MCSMLLSSEDLHIVAWNNIDPCLSKRSVSAPSSPQLPIRKSTQDVVLSLLGLSKSKTLGLLAPFCRWTPKAFVRGCYTAMMQWPEAFEGSRRDFDHVDTINGCLGSYRRKERSPSV